MTWITLLTLALQIAAYFARRSERADIERSLLNELDILQGKRVRAAVDARNAVLDGSVPVDPNDPNKRD